MESENNNETTNQDKTKQTKQQTYDVAGLLIGAVVGIFLAIVGITDILMGIIAGMFIGLVVGTFIKKK
ncbi:MAG: hypothetical protein IKO48_03850 [Elusimicrobia bacterium]|nr:hypothetical protein [Elusimicrobiota bacterium]